MKKKRIFTLGTLFVALLSVIALSFSFTYAAYYRNTSTEQNVSVASRKGFNVYLDATEWDIDGAIFYMYVWRENSSGSPDGSTPKKYLKPIGKTEEGYYIYNYQRTVHNRFLFLRVNPSASSNYFADDADAFVSGVGWNKTADITLYGEYPLVRIISAWGPNDFVASDGSTVLGKISPHECVAYTHTPEGHSGGHSTTTRHEIFNATCEYEGYDDTITWCTDCSHEISRSTSILSAIGHNYVTSYKWETGSNKVKQLRTCQNDKTHVIVDNSDVYSGGSTVSSFSINAGTETDMHHTNFTEYRKSGDINLHFSNFLNGSSGNHGHPYFVNAKIHIANSQSINEGILIKIDNSYYYGYGRYGTAAGKSYAIVKSDLSYLQNDGLSVLSRTDSEGRNSAIASLSTTLPFINDSEGYDVSVEIYFSDVDNRIVTIKLTYYPSKTGRESYRGYYQLFTAQYTYEDFCEWNTVDSVRILRNNYQYSSLSLKELEYSDWIDRDIFSSVYSPSSKPTIIDTPKDSGA